MSPGGFNAPSTSVDDELARVKEELAKAQQTVQEMAQRLAELEKSG